MVSVDKVLLINTMVLPYLVDKTISLSTRNPRRMNALDNGQCDRGKGREHHTDQVDTGRRRCTVCQLVYPKV
jgi:hypothetical protein